MVSEWSGKDLQLDESVWQHIQNILTHRGAIVHDFQKHQAMFPVGAHVMENSKGTAHGFHLNAKSKEIFVLPGPPKEVESILENYLRPWIQKNSIMSDSEITEIWNTMGVGESEIAYLVESLVKDFDVVVGYRVHLPYVEFKITYLKSQQEKNRPLVAAIENALSPILIYKNQYPYQDFFKTFFKTRTALTLIDDVTRGGIFADFKVWIDQWDKQTVAYFNHPVSSQLTAPIPPNGIIPMSMAWISVTHDSQNTVKVVLKSDDLELDFEISTEPYAKTSVERKPLILKEVIYRQLMARISAISK
jgi:molybdopterin-biosynthesis enzyme MoeA-like protein